MREDDWGLEGAGVAGILPGIDRTFTPPVSDSFSMTPTSMTSVSIVFDSRSGKFFSAVVKLRESTCD